MKYILDYCWLNFMEAQCVTSLLPLHLNHKSLECWCFENFNLWQTCQILSQCPSESTTRTLPQVSEFTGQDVSTIVGERMKLLLLPGQPTSESSLPMEAFRVQVISLPCNFKDIACTQSLMRIEKTLDWTFPSTIVITAKWLTWLY